MGYYCQYRSYIGSWFYLYMYYGIPCIKNTISRTFAREETVFLNINKRTLRYRGIGDEDSCPGLYDGWLFKKSTESSHHTSPTPTSCDL